jgi:hypothetical protein
MARLTGQSLPTLVPLGCSQPMTTSGWQATWQAASRPEANSDNRQSWKLQQLSACSQLVPELGHNSDRLACLPRTSTKSASLSTQLTSTLLVTTRLDASSGQPLSLPAAGCYHEPLVSIVQHAAAAAVHRLARQPQAHPAMLNHTALRPKTINAQTDIPSQQAIAAGKLQRELQQACSVSAPAYTKAG